MFFDTVFFEALNEATRKMNSGKTYIVIKSKNRHSVVPLFYLPVKIPVMKTTFYSLLLALMLSGICTAQSLEVRFNHTGGRAEILSREKLENARLASELVSYLRPRSQADLVIHQVKVTGIVSGVSRTAQTDGDALSEEQQSILRSMDVGTETIIESRYTYKGVDKHVEYAVTPGPATEATFPGGTDKLTDYLLGELRDRIPEKTLSDDLGNLSVAFTIDTEGNVAGAMVCVKSGNDHSDELVLDAIKNMPRWNPAKNDAGTGIAQKFNISIVKKRAVNNNQGSGGGC